jgi:hypothetical protein
MPRIASVRLLAFLTASIVLVCMHADGFDQQLVEVEVQISSAPTMHVQGLAEVPVPTKT